MEENKYLESIRFFNSNEIELPRLREDDCDFEVFIAKMFNDYLCMIEEPSFGRDVVTKYIKSEEDTIRNACQGIKEAIGEYLNGFPNKAYSKLESVIGFIEPCFNILAKSTSLKRDQEQEIDGSSIGWNFYRMRADRQDKWSKEDLFHIPFHLRHIVDTQRYSIPGLPCLYVGGSAFVCWEELGRPAIENIKISRLEMKEGKEVKILHFGYRPSTFAAMFEYGTEAARTSREGVAQAYAVCWPLIAACSIKAFNENSNSYSNDRKFKVEHIVPQLLLQWIRSNNAKYSGIRYFSMAVQHSKEHYYAALGLYSNYVFPINESKPNGFCEDLKSFFKITEPIGNESILPKLERRHFDKIPEEDVLMEKGKWIPYQDTALGKAEAALNRLEAKDL